jgi:hypothetical protein
LTSSSPSRRASCQGSCARPTAGTQPCS